MKEHVTIFAKRIRAISNKQVLEVFNQQVENRGWGSARAAFLVALHREFIRRKFDYSAIGNQQTLSLARKVELNNGVVTLKNPPSKKVDL